MIPCHPTPMLQTSSDGSLVGVSRMEVGGEIDSSSELLPDPTLSDLGKGTHREPRNATEGGNVNKNLFSTADGAAESLQTPSLFKTPLDRIDACRKNSPPLQPHTQTFGFILKSNFFLFEL